MDSLVDELGKTGLEDSSTLSFAHQQLKLNEEDDAKEVVSKIKLHGSLKCLMLEGNTLGIGGSKAIGKALEEKPSLTHARWKDIFTGRLKQEIPQCLRFLGSGLQTSGAQLVELDLSDNALGPIGGEGLKPLLESKVCWTLQELKLNNTGLGIHGSKMIYEALDKAYNDSLGATSKPLQLRVFICGRSRLENPGAIGFAGVFKKMGSLEEVSMFQNGIYHEGVAALSDAFLHNPKLRILNLYDNTLTEQGAASLSTALRQLRELRVLNLNDCLLRNKGTESIADALQNGHDLLEELSLSGNEMEAPAALRVLNAIAGKGKMSLIDLGDNEIEDEDDVEAVMSKAREIGVENILSGVQLRDEDEDEEDQSFGEEKEKEVEETLKKAGTALIPEKVSPTDFLKRPSREKLLGLQEEKPDNIVKAIQVDTSDNSSYIEAFVSAMVTVSNFATESDPGVTRVAEKVSEALFVHLLKNFVKDDGLKTSLFSNSLMVNLGLLKNEEQKYIYPENIPGCMIVLSHLLKQSEFPRSTRTCLQMFLNKSNVGWDKYGAERTKLMEVLFRFG